MVCGAIDKLELDHVNRETKRHDISKLLAGASEKIYLEEAKLCQLLCREHHKQKSGAENSVPHGGGKTGKKNCRCDLCKPLKNAYVRELKIRKRQASVAEMD
jgi:hypothetical protein